MGPRPSWVTGKGEVKPHRQKLPNNRQIRGMTHMMVNQSGIQETWQHLRYQISDNYSFSA